MESNIFIRFLVSALVGGVILFLWSGFAQAVLPWGVASAKVYVSQSQQGHSPFQTSETEVLPAHSFTTPEFDKRFVNEVNTLTTDETFSWIITKPIAYYNPMQYLLRETLTQFAIALGLALLLVLTEALPVKTRLMLVVVAALSGGIASFGQMYNWWGLTMRYGGGMILNLCISWSLAGVIVTRFISKSYS